MAYENINGFDIVVGGVYKTNNDGMLEVVSKSSEKWAHHVVRFLETGNEYLVGTSSIRKGLVRDNKRDRTQEFIDACNKVHNHHYSYHNTIYKGAREKVTITCPVHGDIEVHASCHRNGTGCKRCACVNINKYTTEQFIEKSKSIFGDKFSYTKSIYTKNSDKIIITCPVHGDVEITPMHHYLTATGCPECAKDYLENDALVSFEEFRRRATQLHGDRYSYDESSYTRFSHKTKCHCKEHGWWTTGAHNHAINGTGCPYCATNGFKRQLAAYLYVLKSDSMTKVGITNNKVKLRCSQINEHSPEQFSVFSCYAVSGDVAYNVEQKVLSLMRSGEIKQPQEKFDGYTEAFITSPSHVDELVRELIGKENG